MDLVDELRRQLESHRAGGPNHKQEIEMSITKIKREYMDGDIDSLSATGDWGGKRYSKKRAIEYIMNYGSE
jgi:hypothetical protein